MAGANGLLFTDLSCQAVQNCARVSGNSAHAMAHFSMDMLSDADRTARIESLTSRLELMRPERRRYDATQTELITAALAELYADAGAAVLSRTVMRHCSMASSIDGDDSLTHPEESVSPKRGSHQ